MRENVAVLLTRLLSILCLISSAGCSEGHEIGPARSVIDWWYAEWSREFVETVIEPAFEARFPEYDLVSRTYTNYQEVWSNYVLTRQQGSVPALVQGQEIYTQVMRDSGYFKPLWEVVGDRSDVNGVALPFGDIIPAIGAYYQVDGRYYSMPWNVSSAVLFANMDVLVEAGVVTSLTDRGSLPSSWVEMERACELILANTDANCVWWPIDTWWITMPLAQMGQVYINNDNGRGARADEVLLTTDAAIAAFSWWADLESRGMYAPYGPNTDEMVPNADFASGRLAFISHSSGMMPDYRASFASTGQTLAAGYLPHNSDYPYHSVTLGGGTLYLSEGLDPTVEEGALALLAFLLLPENDAKFHRASGYVPVRLSTAHILEEEGWDEDMRVAYDQFRAGQAGPAVGALLPTFPETDEIVLRAIEAILYRDAPILDTLESAQAEATAVLREYNSLIGAP